MSIFPNINYHSTSVAATSGHKIATTSRSYPPHLPIVVSSLRINWLSDRWTNNAKNSRNIIPSLLSLTLRERTVRNQLLWLFLLILPRNLCCHRSSIISFATCRPCYNTPSIFYKRWRKFFARPISYEFQPFCVAPSLKWPLIFEKNLLGHLLFTKSS